MVLYSIQQLLLHSLVLQAEHICMKHSKAATEMPELPKTFLNFLQAQGMCTVRQQS